MGEQSRRLHSTHGSSTPSSQHHPQLQHHVWRSQRPRVSSAGELDSGSSHPVSQGGLGSSSPSLGPGQTAGSNHGGLTLLPYHMSPQQQQLHARQSQHSGNSGGRRSTGGPWHMKAGTHPSHTGAITINGSASHSNHHHHHGGSMDHSQSGHMLPSYSAEREGDHKGPRLAESSLGDNHAASAQAHALNSNASIDGAGGRRGGTQHAHSGRSHGHNGRYGSRSSGVGYGGNSASTTSSALNSAHSGVSTSNNSKNGGRRRKKKGRRGRRGD